SVWVLADVYERDLHLIKLGQRAQVTTTAYQDQSFVAQVSRLGDIVDPTTRALKVRFLVANPGGRLKPEMFATVKLTIDESKKALTLPAEAVITENGKTYVFVSVGARKFVRKPVEVQQDISGLLRVTGGLKAGERVVGNGTLLLRLQ